MPVMSTAIPGDRTVLEPERATGNGRKVRLYDLHVEYWSEFLPYLIIRKGIEIKQEANRGSLVYFPASP